MIKKIATLCFICLNSIIIKAQYVTNEDSIYFDEIIRLGEKDSSPYFYQSSNKLTVITHLTKDQKLRCTAKNNIFLSIGFKVDEGSVFNANISNPIQNENQNSAIKIKNADNSLLSSHEPILENQDLIIFPNPFNGEFSLILSDENPKNVSIVNTLGALVYKKWNYLESRLEIDLSLLPKGVYFLNVTCNGKSYGKKIINQ
jgi:hypothetical protein